ncbi:MAG: carboxypeptidase-like regulatory domain-containing protein [Melioribacter sp.]|nr:carboxypeptidase-like regulatory domain-containing protein [Melioribacter sp.]
MLTKTNRFISLIALFEIIFLATIFNSCESTKTGPIVPAPPTEVSPPAPLVLKGYVKDAVSLASIQGATVILANESGTILTTLATDQSGKYEYDLTNVPGTKLNISASAASYTSKKIIALIDKTNYTATVPTAYLTKITGTAQNIVALTGGQVTSSSIESVSGQPLTLQIPANALSQNTTITVAALTTSSIVPLPQAVNKLVASSANFQPTGINFLQPVSVKFPLPYTATPGKLLDLYRLNPITLTWENRGNATVSSDGKTATAQLTGFSTWAVADNGAFTQTSFSDAQPDAPEQEVASGQTVQHSYTPVISISQKNGDLTDTWIRNIIGYADAFTAYDLRFDSQGIVQPITISYTASPQPDLPNEYKRDVDGNGTLDHYNPAAPNERGTWNWSAVVRRFIVNISGTVTLGNNSAQVSATFKVYKKIRDVWKWVKKHDQGIGG